MISRQRNNLGLTFSAAARPRVSDSSRQRLLTNQTELLNATREFAEGLAARGQSVAPLQVATAAMQEATTQLAASEWTGALTAEQRALAALVQARQNIRQMLAQSNSSSSACRSFDRQQRQKMRTPEELEKEQKSELAEQRRQLDELAQRERKWSEDVQSSSSPGSTALAEAQRQVLDDTKSAGQSLEKLEAASEATRQQAGHAVDDMRRGLEAWEQQQAAEAARRAAAAADKLARLAEHLTALQSRDFLDKLAQSQSAAQKLSREQADVARQFGERRDESPGSTEQQNALATQAELLAELLGRLRADAWEEGAGTQNALDALEGEQAAASIARQMRQAAQAGAQRDWDSAAREAGTAGRRLAELAEGLRQLRDDYAQPKLDELVALEEQLARLLEQFPAGQEGQPSPATLGQLGEIRERLAPLAQQDARLAEALYDVERNATAGNAGQVTPGGQPLPPGVYPGFSPLKSGWLHVNRALQAKIQELILAGALLDADESVPPDFKELVEEYYRALSDDLR